MSFDTMVFIVEYPKTWGIDVANRLRDILSEQICVEVRHDPMHQLVDYPDALNWFKIEHDTNFVRVLMYEQGLQLLAWKYKQTPLEQLGDMQTWADGFVNGGAYSGVEEK